MTFWETTAMSSTSASVAARPSTPGPPGPCRPGASSGPRRPGCPPGPGGAGLGTHLVLFFRRASPPLRLGLYGLDMGGTAFALGSPLAAFPASSPPTLLFLSGQHGEPHGCSYDEMNGDGHYTTFLPTVRATMATTPAAAASQPSPPAPAWGSPLPLPVPLKATSSPSGVTPMPPAGPATQ